MWASCAGVGTRPAKKRARRGEAHCGREVTKEGGDRRFFITEVSGFRPVGSFRKSKESSQINWASVSEKVCQPQLSCVYAVT
jgi:hypothetical protein